MCPVNKKGRLVGYKGLLFLSAPVKMHRQAIKKKSVSVTPLAVKAPETFNKEVTTVWQSNQLAPQTSIQHKAVQEWMCKYLMRKRMTSPQSKTCGFITKKAINWMRIQKDHFFSHVGNIIRHLPFAKVWGLAIVAHVQCPFSVVLSSVSRFPLLAV